MDKYFEIGIVTKAQGIRGEVRVLPTTDDAGRFALLIGKEVGVNGAPYVIEAARTHKSIVLVKFAGVNDRNAAEKLAQQVITIGADLALPLAEGEHYVRDIIGRAVVTHEGEELGILVRVIHTPANEVYVIKPPQGRNFMLPAVRDVVLSVSDVITVRLQDGMKELYI